MPALLLHMTIAEEIVATAPASPLAEAARVARDAYLLGSILPDLPYHARFLTQVVRHLLKRGYLVSEWGDIFHTRGSGRLGLAMLAHARRAQLGPRDTQAVLALVAGYLCHCALDTIVHPAINRRVDAELEHSDHRPDVLHSEVERWQSLLYHYDLLGHDITGRAYARQLIGRTAGTNGRRSRMPTALWQAMRAGCIETHGRAPDPLQVNDWLWGIRTYARLISSPIGRKTEGISIDVERARREHYTNDQFNLHQPLERGCQLTLEYWDAATQLWNSERLSDEARANYLTAVPDVDLATGA
ncbi:MAG: zinc dependent phospholipase C family protein [Deltaproteobacteria bacterium]|nr:zinc dependent phospholipase C family protein [Deltaproteobacteria bacterium]